MSKPRQEFLGPITKLAAVYDTSWMPDGYGIVDGYGAEIHNVTMVLNSRTPHPTTGAGRGSFWVKPGSPTTPWFTDSAGTDISLTGISPGGNNTLLYTDGTGSMLWSGAPTISTLQLTGHLTLDNSSIVTSVVGPTITCFNDSVVFDSRSDFGSTTIGPFIYNQTDGYISRFDKQQGGFGVFGASPQKKLTFQTSIHGHPIQSNCSIMGKMRIGWIGNGNYTNGGCMEFLVVVTTNGFGAVSVVNHSAGDTDGLMHISGSGQTDPIVTVGSDSPSSFYVQFMFAGEAFNQGSKASWQFEYGWCANG
jgi:hypothetical protein